MRENINNSKRAKYIQNTYDQQVLVGNWFERRLADQIDKKAITPAITGKSDCCEYQTTYQAAYAKQKSPFKPDEETVRNAIDLKVINYDNKMNGRNGHIKMYDGDKFLNNFVTTTDIAYRIIPKLIYKQYGDSKLGETPQKMDSFAIYGNATETGLRAWYACEANKLARLGLTTTKSDYIPKPVKPLVKAGKKETGERVFP